MVLHGRFGNNPGWIPVEIGLGISLGLDAYRLLSLCQDSPDRTVSETFLEGQLGYFTPVLRIDWKSY